MDSSRRRVFVSHSSEQSGFAQSLSALLETRGISCWIAPRDLIVGQPYASECVRGIDVSEGFLLLASASAIQSGQVLSEVEQAHKRGKSIYTVLIGKPRIPRELDYYISRLHWIESGTASADGLADRLGAVLSGKETWTDAASPPSLRRTVRYRRDAFMGSLAATGLVAAIIAAAAGYFVWTGMRTIANDYRSFGYVSLATQPNSSSSTDLHVEAHVWLLAKDVRFRDVTLTAIAHNPNGSVARSNLPALDNPDQVGGVTIVDFVVPAATKRVTACLSVPASAGGDRRMVTQTFQVPAGAGGVTYPVSLSPVTEPAVQTDTGAACGQP